ncbi:MAG: type II toxin-antitoxin system HicB family antitoxin [Methanoregulaceae archaeon]|jgi:predicted RNase H-like HicB family nuclease|nr:type II toxin-antitoxin system HicB family antitoxin [Methanoregulaceae archaeon]
MKLKVVLELAEEGGYVVSIPALPGCWSQGETRDEAIANIREAAIGWLEAQQDKIERTHPPTDVDLINL